MTYLFDRFGTHTRTGENNETLFVWRGRNVDVLVVIFQNGRREYERAGGWADVLQRDDDLPFVVVVDVFFCVVVSRERSIHVRPAVRASCRGGGRRREDKKASLPSLPCFLPLASGVPTSRFPMCIYNKQQTEKRDTLTLKYWITASSGVHRQDVNITLSLTDSYVHKKNKNNNHRWWLVASQVNTRQDEKERRNQYRVNNNINNTKQRAEQRAESVGIIVTAAVGTWEGGRHTRYIIAASYQSVTTHKRVDGPCISSPFSFSPFSSCLLLRLLFSYPLRWFPFPPPPPLESSCVCVWLCVQHWTEKAGVSCSSSSSSSKKRAKKIRQRHKFLWKDPFLSFLFPSMAAGKKKKKL